MRGDKDIVLAMKWLFKCIYNSILCTYPAAEPPSLHTIQIEMFLKDSSSRLCIQESELAL